MRSGNNHNTVGSQLRENIDDAKKEAIDTAVDKGMDILTKGAYSTLRKAPVVGNVVDKAGQKVKKAVSQVVDPTQHKRPDLGVTPSNNVSIDSTDSKTDTSTQKQTPSGDIGNRRLSDSLGRRALNLIMGRSNAKKKKKKDEKQGETTSSNETNGNENPLNNESDDDGNNLLDSVVEKKKKLREIKIGLLIGVAVLVFVVFTALITLIDEYFTGNSVVAAPFLNSLTYGTDSYTPIYENNSNNGKEETNYHKKLEQLANEYQNKTGMLLKTNYIHAILIYPYIEKAATIENTDALFDFKKMNSMIDTVYKLMTANGNSIDYNKQGSFYNGVMASNDIRNYYKEVLKKDINIGEILDDIFDLADALSSVLEKKETTTVTEETTITVTNQNNNNNTPSKTLTINEYLADSIYANTDSVNNDERVKAYTIAYSTNIVSVNKQLSVSDSNASMNNETCSVKLGCSYDKNGKLVDGPGERGNGNTVYYNGNYYYKIPLKDDEISSLNKSINSVLGNVLVNEDGTYPNLNILSLSGFGNNSSDYKTILSGYGNYNYKNIGEDSYANGVNYGYAKVLTEVVFYDQKDYSDNSFCGTRTTIGRSGCGITSMAIVVSTYEHNNQYSPLYMNKMATSGLGQKYCSYSGGTNISFFGAMAAKMGYSYTKGYKHDKRILNLVTTNLSKGNLVIVHMGKGRFTDGGHYMVLGGIDPETKKVYVYDPNNRSNKSWDVRKTGNGWYSFNDVIVKEARGDIPSFHIIVKG